MSLSTYLGTFYKVINACVCMCVRSLEEIEKATSSIL